jgi:cobalt-zinc-cadmium efflux system membrane fusion protein
VLDNPDGLWRPGLFVNGRVETASEQAAVVVPRSAVIGMNEESVVFVQTNEGFRPRRVRLGRKTEQHVEIIEGLDPGERYAATNVLTLKAQLNSAALDHAGHAH